MIDEAQAKLQAEQAKGEEIERVMNSYFRPFLEAKREVLFEAFQNVPVSNLDGLKDVKLQLTALNALEAHFLEFINTGKLAKHQLEK